MYARAASKLLKKGWAPLKAYEWMAKAWPLAEHLDRARLQDDTLTEERRQDIKAGGYRAQVATDYLRAMKLAGKSNVPPSLRAYLEGPLPPAKAEWTLRYRALAWLAAVDAREADALAYFQQALFTRVEAPQFLLGKVADPLSVLASRRTQRKPYSSCAVIFICEILHEVHTFIIGMCTFSSRFVEYCWALGKS